jgi:hypothetical protein
MSLPTPNLRRALLVLACGLFLLLSRMPAMLCRFELNPDESQMAAQAMRYGQDLTPWRAVEGETNGPLDSWFLLALHQAGMPYSYRALHVVAALSLVALLFATYGAARALAGEAAALVTLGAGTWWLAWAPVEDLAHYSSELVPAFLVSAALALVGRARRTPAGPDWRRGLAAGCLLGLAPWAKLQAGPVALAVGLWAVADGVLNAAPWACRRRYVGALVAGALGPGLVFLTWIAWAGSAVEFWRIYVLGGLYHGRAQPWGEHLHNAATMLARSDDSPWFWSVALLLAGAAALLRRAAWRAVPRRIWCLAVMWSVVGVFVALRPVTQRTHYALFFLAPLALLAGLVARVLAGEASRLGPPWRRRAAWAVVALAVLPLPALNFISYKNYLGLRLVATSDRPFWAQQAVAGAVRHFVPRPRSLAVWGWKPSLYVDLGLAPATRNAVYAFLTDGNPDQEFLRAAFMDDLRKSRPEVIVDVEDFVYRGARQTAPETFPALEGYLEQNYLEAGNADFHRSADYTTAIVIYRRAAP